MQRLPIGVFSALRKAGGYAGNGVELGNRQPFKLPLDKKKTKHLY